MYRLEMAVIVCKAMLLLLLLYAHATASNTRGFLGQL